MARRARRRHTGRRRARRSPGPARRPPRSPGSRRSATTGPPNACARPSRLTPPRAPVTSPARWRAPRRSRPTRRPIRRTTPLSQADPWAAVRHLRAGRCELLGDSCALLHTQPGPDRRPLRGLSHGRRPTMGDERRLRPGLPQQRPAVQDLPGDEAPRPRHLGLRGDISFDIGAINLAAAPSGQIQDALGARGITFNRLGSDFKDKRFKIFGYPADPPAFYDGQRLILCDSPSRASRSSPAPSRRGPATAEGLERRRLGLRQGAARLGGQPRRLPHRQRRLRGDVRDLLQGLRLQPLGQGRGWPAREAQEEDQGCRRKDKNARRCLVKAETFKPVVR